MKIYTLSVGGVSTAQSKVLIPKEKDSKGKSIIVLPFDDLSDAQDQEFFGKGIAESIINKLTNVEKLNVISRTSSFEFKNQGKPLFSLCDSLGVDWLIEGSVRKSGNKLRITAQLIQVKDQTHVFSYEEDKYITDK